MEWRDGASDIPEVWRRLWIPALMALPAAQGQEPAMRARASMEASIAKQRESVRRQVAGQAAAEFFTVPWVSSAPEPVAPALASMPDVSGNCEAIPKDELSRMVDSAAEKEGLDASLLHAVIQKESAGKPCAVSSKGAQGLMQLMPATAQQFGVVNPLDPKQNLEAGSKLLKQLLVRYDGDLSKALGAYNAGPARVDKSGGVPDIPETVRYVATILSNLVVP